MHDHDLIEFEAHGALPLPAATTQKGGEEGYVENEGARIWYASFGSGPPVLLLHGGLGHGGNWGYQVPALLDDGYRVVLLDSRGHGQSSTREERHFSYELMASDTLAVMDTLRLERAALVGWSDGACTALILGRMAPERFAGVFFFGCNMDPSGTKEFEMSPVVERCFHRHTIDYARLSATPEQWDAFVAAVSLMQRTQPNYSVDDLAQIRGVAVAIVQSDHDEFLKGEHAPYLARSIPGATLTILPGVSHFAPLQRPDQFSREVLAFLGRVLPADHWSD